MTTTAVGGPARRNTVVAVVCGVAVLLVVVLAVLLVPGPGGAAPASAPAGSAAPWPPPPPPSASVAPSASSSAPSSSSSSPSSPSSSSSSPSPPPSTGDPAPPVDPGPAGGAPGPAPTGPAPGSSQATPAPGWLGSRPLAPAGSGPVGPQETPPELLDRRVVTVDVLPPPPDGRFSPVVSPVPADVLARSTWQPACPVTVEELRYLLVQHWGFDGRLHTGEVLVHADAVDVVVEVFAAMHAERFPLEEVRVVRADELDAAPTGDGNVTSSFVCRPSVGGGGWSRHAYGRALDVNPFHNPYDRGRGDDRLVLPELATAYTDRGRELPGMLSSGSAAVVAAESAGWGWGGRWSSAEDWMHLSDDGR